MARPLRHITITFFLLLFALTGAAQEIHVGSTVDRNTIEAGEHIRFQITLSNTRERFAMPDLGGLVVLQGPFESSGFEDVNGRVRRFVHLSWTLTATKPGSYTIAPVVLQAGGKTYRTAPIVVEVTKASGPDASDPNVVRGQTRNTNLFATITLSAGKVHVGQPVVATYTLYSRYGNLDPVNYEMPELTGFWNEEIEVKNKGWKANPQVVNGIPYHVATLKNLVLLPQKSGKLRIEPMELTFVANRTLFNRGSTLTIQSNAAELTVLPLPTPAPPGFNGAVGDLNMTVQTDRTEVRANEAVQFNVRFSGKGNLKLLEAPDLQLPVGFEAYEPKVTDKIATSTNGMTGSREFEYLIIPRHEGEHELVPPTFSYFDTKSNAYRSVTSPALTIRVLPGEGGASAIAAHPGRTDVQVLENDIRYIRTGAPDLGRRDGLLFGSAPWLAGMAAPALAFVLFAAWRRKRERALADVVGMRSKLADRVARKHLAQAAKLIDTPDRAPFHTALSKALQGYMTDKFQLGIAQLTRTAVQERLSALPEGHALADRYVALITACDIARFAPVEERPRRELYNDAAALIGRIENELRP